MNSRIPTESFGIAQVVIDSLPKEESKHNQKGNSEDFGRKHGRSVGEEQPCTGGFLFHNSYPTPWRPASWQLFISFSLPETRNDERLGTMSREGFTSRRGVRSFWKVVSVTPPILRRPIGCGLVASAPLRQTEGENLIFPVVSRCGASPDVESGVEPCGSSSSIKL